MLRSLTSSNPRTMSGSGAICTATAWLAGGQSGQQVDDALRRRGLGVLLSWRVGKVRCGVRGVPVHRAEGDGQGAVRGRQGRRHVGDAQYRRPSRDAHPPVGGVLPWSPPAACSSRRPSRTIPACGIALQTRRNARPREKVAGEKAVFVGIEPEGFVLRSRPDSPNPVRPSTGGRRAWLCSATTSATGSLPHDPERAAGLAAADPGLGQSTIGPAPTRPRAELLGQAHPRCPGTVANAPEAIVELGGLARKP